MSRALVYGLAVAGESTLRALLRHGHEVVVIDDTVTDERRRRAETLDVELIEHPDEDTLDRLVRSCAMVSPSPGVPETHPVVRSAQAHEVELVSEIELAYRWEQDRVGGPRPMLAVTGTDGKTTTTLLIVEILRQAGLRSVDAGNTATPLVDAITMDLDVLVVEATSFRLAWTPTFRATGAAWLNLAPDHLNWHRDMASYEAAKAQIWANQGADDVAVGFIGDAAVAARLRAAPGRQVSFAPADAQYCVADGELVGPSGTICAIDSMRRSLPHDLTNALAASALVLETGLAGVADVAAALSSFHGPAHRLESLGTWDDVAWFNDSKATTPHAASAAIRSFDRVVLIAGGYDKGVDLRAMATDTDRIDAVLAIGDTAAAVAEVFAAVPVVEVVGDLAAAVARAAAVASAGSTVLLSPGCASFDQYRGFEERGEHFRALVLERHQQGATR